MAAVNNPIAVVTVYLWIGFVCAISFMEAWLKFRAPGVTLPLGLGIGRVVFNALNKVEIVFALTILCSFFVSRQQLLSLHSLFFFIPVLILIVQTFWLLPLLDKRAELLINGFNARPSRLHLYYVVGEVLKVTALVIFSIKLFR
jgi:hypothetical protein